MRHDIRGEKNASTCVLDVPMFLTSMELFNLWKGCKGVCVREVCTRSVHVAQPERWRRNKCVRREGDKLVGRYPFRPWVPTGTVKRSRGLAKWDLCSVHW